MNLDSNTINTESKPLDINSLRIFKSKKEDFTIDIKNQLIPYLQDMHSIGVQLPPPGGGQFKIMLNQPVPEYKDEFWILAMINEKIVGYIKATWNTNFENTNRIFIQDFYVIEELRRKGIGKKMLQLFLESIPNHIDIIDYWAIEKTVGEQFMMCVFKKEPSYTIRQSVSSIREFDKDEVMKKSNLLKEETGQKGYSVEFIDDVNYDELFNIQQYIKAQDEIHLDVPLEELSYDRPEMTVERYLKGYQRGKEQGFRYYTFVAIKDDNVVAMTETCINKFQPEVGWQMLTGVIPLHRGDHLGLTLKYQMLSKLLRETDVKYWFTDNAGSNIHMIRINDELGYKEWPKGYLYEIKKEDVNLE